MKKMKIKTKDRLKFIFINLVIMFFSLIITGSVDEGMMQKSIFTDFVETVFILYKYPIVFIGDLFDINVFKGIFLIITLSLNAVTWALLEYSLYKKLFKE